MTEDQPTNRVDGEAPPSAFNGRVVVLQQRALRLNAQAPQPKSAEERVLAGLLAGGRQAWAQVGDLAALDFEVADHQALFTAIVGQLARHMPLDPASLYPEFQAALGRTHTQVVFRDVLERWQHAIKPADALAVVAELAPVVRAAARERVARRAADPTRISAEEAQRRWGNPSTWVTPAPGSPEPTPPASGWAGLEIVERLP